ncbi:MAG: PIG-L family deacetylase [Gemmatimonadaceae bacterium]
MSRRLAVAVLALALLAPSLRAQDHGAAALARAVALLGPETPRVLYIAAHPDDEDVRLITWLSRSGRAEVAYLSLTRGDGGQNLIGDELGEALGVVRTQELLSARRIDGARQYFSRAYDFGFSKTDEETYTHWPRDSVLNDVMRVVRAFRPHVIVATFSGTPRDNHGQHQVSGQLARDAYELAGDIARFPVAEYGPTWTVSKLYRNASFYPDGTHVAMNVGEYNPLSGRSYDEVASLSRSQHKSQGLRGNYRFGEVLARYYREASRVTPEIPREQETSILDGLRAASAPGTARAAREYAAIDVRSPGTAIPYIAAHAPRDDRVRLQYDRAAIAATGLAFEAISPRAFVAVGDSVVIDYALHNRGTVTVRIDSAAGAFSTDAIAPGMSVRWKAALRPPRRDEPWWLERPRVGDMFADPPPRDSEDQIAEADWPRVKVAVVGLPVPVLLQARPTYRLSQGFFGDAVAPLVAAPGITVTPAQNRAFVRAGSRFDRDVYVNVRSSFDSARAVSVALEAPSGVSVTPTKANVTVAAGGTRTVVFRISGSAEPGRHRLRIVADASGRMFAEAVRIIDYPHIAVQHIYEPAALRLTAVPVNVPANLHVGYIAGRADAGPQVLSELGVRVTHIDPAEIPRMDLSPFSVIVVGPRMYEASADLLEHNGRLLEYVNQGGRLVVQFGQDLMAQPGILPYPITVRRPRPGVTVETAPVTITDPAARELIYPNRITSEDFDGWVQERSAFDPTAYDPRYRTMISMHDPGQAPVHSSILVAQIGRGTYVYTTLALFRQLHEGVPGAVRLFVNLLAP